MKPSRSQTTILALVLGLCAACGKGTPSTHSTKAQGATVNEHTVFFHHDAQGSVVATTDASGAVVGTEGFLPFGAPDSRTGVAEETTAKYTGQTFDHATGLYYYGARYYDAATATFISADSYGGEDGALQTHNRYAYVLNNPYSYVDPDGRVPIPVIIAGAIALWNAYDTASDVASTAQVVGSGASAGEKAAALGMLALGTVDPTPGNLLRKGGTKLVYGGTHRVAAILQVAKSGDMGALRKTDVVGAKGETVSDIVGAYDRGELGTINSFFDSSKAGDIAESLRMHGYVDDYSSARTMGMSPDHAYRDQFHRLEFRGVPGDRAARIRGIADLPQFRDFVSGK